MVALLTAVAASGVGAAEVPSYAPKELLVRLDGGAGKVAAAGLFARLRLVASRPILPPNTGSMRPARGSLSAWHLFRIESGADPAAVVDTLTAHGLVAHPNRIYGFHAAPNDPEWGRQWGPKMIGLETVWEQIVANTIDSALVAIIDSGIDYLNPDLAPRVWRNVAEVVGIAGVDDDGNGYVDDTIGWDFTDSPDLPGTGDYLDRDNDPMDGAGHGTGVAAIVAAGIDDGIGVAGVAPTAKVMALRAGAELDFGGGFLEEDDIAAAFVYAVENDADVINMSFGDVVSSPLMRDVTSYAEANGVVLVASAGNENEDSILYPAAYDEVIAVGATASDEVRATFSSYGENLDLVAPGSRIFTARLNGVYAHNAGTSFSAPHVAGAAATLLGLAPGLTPRQVRSTIRAGVLDLGPPGWDAEYGTGRLDLPTLLRATTGPTAEIVAPARRAGADTALEWSIAVAGVPPVAWTLGYGMGRNAEYWTTIDVGTQSEPSSTIGGLESTSALPETSYVWRLVVTDGLGRTREDRTVVTIDHTAPEFVHPLAIRRRWSQSRQVAMLEWETADLTVGSVDIWRGTSAEGPADVELPVNVDGRFHIERFPSALTGDGPVVARVRALDAAGLWASGADVHFTPERLSVPRSGYDLHTAAPSGILMPGLSDFDRDGHPEVAVKLATRFPYDTVSFYEIAPTGDASLQFESPVPMRPVAVGDLDADGLMELIGIDRPGDPFFVVVAEQTTRTSAPTRVAWRTFNILAPTLGDIDSDGKADLTVLDEVSRKSLYVYEAPGVGQLDQLAQVAELAVPEELPDGRLGIGRADCDLDGDGRMTVVVGTAGGEVMLFHSLGDNSFAAPEVIHGDGDATRVWGGADLSGDGKDNFAVLRFVERDKYEIDARHYSLEVYGDGPDPLLVREFADPPTDGVGMAAGPVGPDGRTALVVAFAPRMYVIVPSVTDADGMVWYADTGRECQPVVGDVDLDGVSDLVYRAAGRTIVARRPLSAVAPPPPTELTLRPRDSVSVVASWDMLPGLRYRLWAGSDPDSLTIAVDNAESPVAFDNLPEGSQVTVAAQSIAVGPDGIVGPLGDPITVAPRRGPYVLSANRVSAQLAMLEFDRPLDSRYASGSSFALIVPGRRVIPSSTIVDRDARRVLLSFAGIDWADGWRLSVAVRDTGGAERTTVVDLVPDISRTSFGIDYVLAASANTLIAGFTHALSIRDVPTTVVELVGGPAVQAVSAANDRTVEVELSSPLNPDASFVLVFRSLPIADGRHEPAAAVVGGAVLSSSAPTKIVAVLQRSLTELWVVTTRPLDLSELAAGDVRVMPGAVVVGVEPGIADNVISVTLDPATPVGPWSDEYSIAIFTSPGDTTHNVLEGTWTPYGDRPFTGHLTRVELLDGTAAADSGDVRLRFDVQIADSGHAADAIRVEPALQLSGYVVRGTSVDLTLADETPIGPWGTSYFVYVDGLLTADGNRLTEYSIFRFDPPAGLDSMTVYPQPFERSAHGSMRFGGVPVGTSLRVYTLTGELVFLAEDIATGGVEWNGRNMAGTGMASGVYVYVAEAAGRKRIGKVAIVR